MKFDIVRAWKDEAYRHSLSEEELSLLPESPIGEVELTDADLEAVQGGHGNTDECNNTVAVLCLQSLAVLLGLCNTNAAGGCL
jgi:mersacidin/lichenicidin family type 2 lantibiotic